MPVGDKPEKFSPWNWHIPQLALPPLTLPPTTHRLVLKFTQFINNLLQEKVSDTSLRSTFDNTLFWQTIENPRKIIVLLAEGTIASDKNFRKNHYALVISDKRLAEIICAFWNSKQEIPAQVTGCSKMKILKIKKFVFGALIDGSQSLKALDWNT